MEENLSDMGFLEVFTAEKGEKKITQRYSSAPTPFLCCDAVQKNTSHNNLKNLSSLILNFNKST
jgi:hypothetical protein